MSDERGGMASRYPELDAVKDSIPSTSSLRNRDERMTQCVMGCK